MAVMVTVRRCIRCRSIVRRSTRCLPQRRQSAAPALTLPNAVIELSNSEDDTVADTLDGERFDMQPRYNQKLTPVRHGSSSSIVAETLEPPATR